MAHPLAANRIGTVLVLLAIWVVFIAAWWAGSVGL